jgi:hypothetical protein
VVNLTSFALINCLEYSVKLLNLEDAAVLQILYDRCADLSLLSVGKPFSPTEARDEFDVVPDGKTSAGKYIFWLLDPRNNLIGAIESIRHYPDDLTWWIGLMMLSPKVLFNNAT